MRESRDACRTTIGVKFCVYIKQIGRSSERLMISLIGLTNTNCLRECDWPIWGACQKFIRKHKSFLRENLAGVIIRNLFNELQKRVSPCKQSRGEKGMIDPFR